MRARRTIPATTACARHSDRPALVRCGDCSKPLCRACAVEVPKIGTMCSECAMRRTGVSRRGGVVYVEDRPDEELVTTTWPHRSGVAVQLFEAMVGDREPHPLISGLTERLEEAGADPEDVVNDDELRNDIARLQDIAVATPKRRRWHR